MKTLVVGLVAGWAILVILAQLFADRLMFVPPRPSYSDSDLPVVHVSTEDGAEIAVIHLPNPAAEFTVIYSHGNAEDLGDIVQILELVRGAGYAVIGYDYRGYGASRDSGPTAAGVVRDHEAVYRWARDELGIPDDRLVLFGRSIGSGPALELAARRPIAGVVIESGFVGVYRVVTRIPLLPFEPFPNLRRIRDVRAPVLIIHGARDEVIPPNHGRRLFDAAPEPKRAFWVDDAGHNDLVPRAGSRYPAALHDFMGLLQQTEFHHD